MTTSILVEHDRTAHVDVRLRFLHLRRRDDGWDEATEREIDVSVELVNGADETIRHHPVGRPRSDADQRVHAHAGHPRRLAHLAACRCREPRRSGHRRRRAARDLLLTALIGTHILFAAPVDAFVSLLEPPDWAIAAAAACVHHRCWPVVVGPSPRRDLMLGSPVILYDHPSSRPRAPATSSTAPRSTRC